MFFKSMLLALVLFGAVPHVNAQSTQGPASVVVNMLAQKAIAVMQDAKATPEVKKAKLRALLMNGFDLNAVSKFALGTAWRSATPAQKAEYAKLYQAMVVEVYSRRFSDYKGQTFTVTGETKQANGDTLVSSLVKGGSSNDLKVDWRVRGSKVVDVIVEGVSMAVTQRSDFASVIEQGGGKLDKLFDYLRAQASSKAANAG